ncbi:hypothetical protein KC343_g945 [Hortaea werneckii]|nr:hypothetical protein KC352_g6276 [Hortaea werneckii]KAI7572204.1 hypothetical protein KC317_g965 [Hortaea werneckii]KAI7628266.1 hypothetical protein KC346_g284 [Hortaea werneckii]KAI7636992.1 hypothetical protein KC343_g945 [Hortaea werneckii]KAI7678067.1 hypothetical protein KC319_g3553 [Hortaea werneckii]
MDDDRISLSEHGQPNHYPGQVEACRSDTEQQDQDSVLLKPGLRVNQQRSSSTASQRPSSLPPSARPENPKQTTSTVPPDLRYRKRYAAILLFYLPILILPWAFTCVLSVRPISHPSYYNQRGEFGGWIYVELLSWMAAVNVLNTIASVITIPALSCLVAQAAVVYCQRRKKAQAINLRQTLVLADRGWLDPAALWDPIAAFCNEKPYGGSTRFQWIAFGLFVVAIVQPPLRGLLTSLEYQTIMTSQDFPDNGVKLPQVAIDPEPVDLARAPRSVIVDRVIDDLATVRDTDFQSNLWIETGQVAESGEELTYQSAKDVWLSNSLDWFFGSVPEEAGYPHKFFVSAVPRDTSTGVLRQHAMRMNSSAECADISQDEFPSQCGGDLPFSTSYDAGNETRIRICVPGNHTQSPWSLTRDRQDIQEEIFIDFTTYLDPDKRSVDQNVFRGRNFTAHCTTKSTRGYFELANYRNNYTAQPLLDKWPDRETLQTDFNDYLEFFSTNVDERYQVPSTIDEGKSQYWNTYPDTEPGHDDLANTVTPGPLMTAAIAMFGNSSFFATATDYKNDAAYNASTVDLGNRHPTRMEEICRAGKVPFANLKWNIYAELPLAGCSEEYYSDIYPEYEDATSSRNRLEDTLYAILVRFSTSTLAYGVERPQGSTPPEAGELLETAMFFANKELLTSTATQFWFESGRKIWYSPGSLVIRPSVSPAALGVISTLIFLQVAALLALLWYIYTVPTWTPSLNSVAVAQLTRRLADDHLPPIGRLDDKSLRKLEELDGVVGVLQEDEVVQEKGCRASSTSQGTEEGAGTASARQSSSSAGRASGEGHESIEVGQSQTQIEEQDCPAINVSSSLMVLARGASGPITKRTRRQWEREHVSSTSAPKSNFCSEVQPLLPKSNFCSRSSTSAPKSKFSFCSRSSTSAPKSKSNFCFEVEVELLLPKYNFCFEVEVKLLLPKYNFCFEVEVELLLPKYNFYSEVEVQLLLPEFNFCSEVEVHLLLPKSRSNFCSRSRSSASKSKSNFCSKVELLFPKPNLS